MGIDSSKIRESVLLRIAGDGLDFDGLKQTLGLASTRARRKGEVVREGGPPAEHDLWVYRLAADDKTTLDERIKLLHETLRPHNGYLQELKKRFQVTVECSWRFRKTGSTEFIAIEGMQIAHESLHLFTELELPLRVRLLFTNDS